MLRVICMMLADDLLNALRRKQNKKHALHFCGILRAEP
jgi:hypothetical protein